MKNNFDALEKCVLFSGIDPQDLSGLLACLGARVTSYLKNQAVFSEGDPAGYIGIVLSGAVQISRDDPFGNRSILARAERGELFGESYALANVQTLPVSVTAAENSRIMLINAHRITVSCSNACGFHSRLIRNMLQIVAKKNLAFHQKIEITSKRTTREKLMAYLLMQAKQQGSNSFTIPYDRQGLADYLGVERSAMSAELSKLRKDGVLECDRSSFTLL